MNKEALTSTSSLVYIWSLYIHPNSPDEEKIPEPKRIIELIDMIAYLIEKLVGNVRTKSAWRRPNVSAITSRKSS